MIEQKKYRKLIREIRTKITEYGNEYYLNPEFVQIHPGNKCINDLFFKSKFFTKHKGEQYIFGIRIIYSLNMKKGEIIVL